MRQKEWEFGGKSVSDMVISKQEGYLWVLPKSCEEEKFFEKKKAISLDTKGCGGMS